MNVKSKLVLFCLLVGLLPTALMGFYSVKLATDSLSDAAFNQLTSVRDARKRTVTELLGTWHDEARIYATSKDVYNALGMLRDYAWGEAKAGERMDVTAAEYTELAAYVSRAFTPFVKKLGYADAYLIGDDGRILYTVQGGRDLGEDLAKGALLQDSNLAAAWKRALEGQTTFADMAAYPALDGAPAMFVASPVLDHTGAVEGVAALRLPVDRLSSIMNGRAGMGDTGETYIVGPDGLLRSDSLQNATTPMDLGTVYAAPDEARITTKAATAALAGEADTRIITDYGGVETLSAYAPVQVHGLSWALLAEVDTAEAFAPVRRLWRAALLLGAVTGCIILALTILFVRREITRPLDAVTAFLRQTAAGDFSCTLEGTFKAEMLQLASGVRQMFNTVKERLGFAQGVLTGIAQPCLVLDPQGRLAFINTHALTLLGSTQEPEALTGQPLEQVLPGGDADAALPLRALAQRVPLAEEQALATHSGAKQVSISATPIYDLDGDILGAFAMYYDLTHIREQEQRIQEHTQSLERVAQQAAGIASQVSEAATELHGRSQSMEQGAMTQSRRTESTAASVQQMSATTLDVAQNASDAAHSATIAREKAEGGNAIVEEAVTAIGEVHERTKAIGAAMDELSVSAEGIGKIMTVIEDIADQTNLLALNAAIEAARAGEAGRGFAVVADEVRKLAEKTMLATRDVAQSISSIQSSAASSREATAKAEDAVTRSTALAEESGRALQEIVELVAGTADQIHTIAAAGDEQSAASEEIRRAVEDISSISRTTATESGNALETIASLETQAKRLESLIQSIR
jgi:methyl-accepting chemotaxis protein